jgi:asparagine synthase (glutamine-hydrolysing)
VKRTLAGVIGATARLGRSENRLAAVAADLRSPTVDAMFRNRVSRWADPAGLVIGGTEPPTPFDEVAQSTVVAEPAQRMMLLDLVSYLPDDILVKVDRTTMAVSLEARNPLLDHRVVEFALRLPVSLKLREGRGKWILRQVLARYVPAAQTDRAKTGFGAPVRAWLAGPLRDWAAALLDPARLRQQGYLDAAIVDELWCACQAGRRTAHQNVWDVLMFQSWLEAQGALPAQPRT